MTRTYLAALLIVMSNNLAATDIYPRFAMRQADIDAVIKSGITTKVEHSTPLPADISYICADVKYKDGALKFCECGDGIYMSFRTAEVELNGRKQDVVSPYWGIFWNYLKQFNLPIWHVGGTGAPNSMAMDELKKLGGKQVPNLSDLEYDPLFKRLCTANFKKTNSIKNYKGIIVYRAKTEHTRDGYLFTKFQQDHPQFLFVNSIAREHIKRKDNTHRLFARAGLDSYIPQFKVIPGVYDPKLVQTVIDELGGSMFIVKPVFNSLSNGVNAVHKEDLDDLLKLILRDKKDITSHHRSLNFWKRSSSAAFICEYAPSKTIMKDNKPYDPTMRIVFMVHQDNNTITTTPIAGFWKIPVKSLIDDVSPTDKHITIAHAGAYYSGILADKQDWNQIKDILHTIMPQLYGTMLTQIK